MNQYEMFKLDSSLNKNTAYVSNVQWLRTMPSLKASLSRV